MLILHLLWIVLFGDHILADVFVYNAAENITVTAVADLPALFGPVLPDVGLQAFAVKSSPHDGCSTVKPPPPGPFGPYVLVVKRYNCSFKEKVLHAQIAGYSAVIVRNVGSNELEVMNGKENVDEIFIPSVFIGEDDGLMIENHFLYDSGYSLVLDDNLPFNLKDYLLPFAVTIGVCFLLLLTFMIIKCVRDYKQSRRHRLSSRALKKLPIHKFQKGDPYECCAVCLDDYIDNDKLRVLPCQHAYHAKCIDPWLTKNRRVCPVCKRKVVTGDERPSDLDSDSDDEYAPLVNSNAGTQGGTFNSQRENPFTAAERRTRRPNRYMPLGEEETSEDSSGEDEQSVGAVAPIDPQVVEVSASIENVQPSSHIVEIKSDGPDIEKEDCVV